MGFETEEGWVRRLCPDRLEPEYGFDDEDYEDEHEEEEEEDRSLDLLLRFVENVFRKVSKRARRAVRSILPVSISTKLVKSRPFECKLMIVLRVLCCFVQCRWVSQWMAYLYLRFCGSWRPFSSRGNYTFKIFLNYESLDDLVFLVVS